MCVQFSLVKSIFTTVNTFVTLLKKQKHNLVNTKSKKNKCYAIILAHVRMAKTKQ